MKTCKHDWESAYRRKENTMDEGFLDVDWHHDWKCLICGEEETTIYMEYSEPHKPGEVSDFDKKTKIDLTDIIDVL